VVDGPTLSVFGGLTLAAFTTKKDFSFLRPILSIGFFLMLGFAHRRGLLDAMTRRRWLAAAAAAGAAATAWCLTQPVPGHVVNDSHPAHLLVGLAWLSLFFAARPTIEALAGSRPGRSFISVVNRRTMTIYLWHSTAVIVTFELLRHLQLQWPTGGFTTALLTGTAAVTLLFVLAFGWIEDLANRRSPRLWPTPAVASQDPYEHLRPRRTLPRPAFATAVAGVGVGGGDVTGKAEPILQHQDGSQNLSGLLLLGHGCVTQGLAHVEGGPEAGGLGEETDTLDQRHIAEAQAGHRAGGLPSRPVECSDVGERARHDHPTGAVGIASPVGGPARRQLLGKRAEEGIRRLASLAPHEVLDLPVGGQA